MTTSDVIGNDNDAVPETTVGANVAVGTAVRSATVISGLVSVLRGSTRLVVAVAVIDALPPVTVVSTAPRLAVSLNALLLRVMPSVIVLGLMKKLPVLVSKPKVRLASIVAFPVSTGPLPTCRLMPAVSSDTFRAWLTGLVVESELRATRNSPWLNCPRTAPVSAGSVASAAASPWTVGVVVLAR